MRNLVVSIVIMCGAVSPAFAEDTPTRNSTLATTLSIGATLVPAVTTAAIVGERNDALLLSVAATSWLLGPSLGHWYAGEVVTTGFVLRLSGGAAILGAAGMARGDTSLDTVLVVAVAGGTAVVVGAIQDWMTAGDAADRYTARHALVPLVTPSVDAAGNARLDVGISGSF